MGAYVVRRLVQLVPILLGITLVTFALAQAMPGDPFSAILDPRFSAQDYRRLLHQHGLDDPWPVQYLRWLGHLVRGEWGVSFVYRAPVEQVIAERLPVTLAVALLALLIAWSIGLPLGVLSAVRRYSLLDGLVTVLAFSGISLPSFFLGLMAIRWLSIQWGLFPTGGVVTPGARLPFPWNYLDMLHHLLLPAAVLGAYSAAGLMRYVRSSMLEVLGQEYVQAARAKGLSERVVLYRHALRNALIPVITILGLEVPALMAGAAITEYLFSLPGMGQLAYLAVIQRDYPVIMATTVLFALFTVLGNLVADLAYAWVDPRIRYQ